MPREKELRINRQIRSSEVVVIDEQRVMLGTLPIKQALTVANEHNLDLVEVDPGGTPPVCRLMDYGKFKYAQSKSERENRANRKPQELREVKLKARIDEHDFEVKSKAVIRFIDGGDRVKISLRFRGRELCHAALGMQLLERLFKCVEDKSVIVQKPLLDGRQMVMILAPKPSA